MSTMLSLLKKFINSLPICLRQQRGFALPVVVVSIMAISFLGGGLYVVGFRPQNLAEKTRNFWNTPIWNPNQEATATKSEEGDTFALENPKESECIKKELNRICVDCNLAEITKQRENCSTYKEVIADTTCKEDCYKPQADSTTYSVNNGEKEYITPTKNPAPEHDNDDEKWDSEEFKETLKAKVESSYHMECRDGMCVSVDGGGSDSCSFDGECNHYECRDGMCVNVNGTGDDQCYGDSECTHYECRNGKCIEVNGAGEPDQCKPYSLSDCTHKECRDGLCVDVAGSGEDQCRSFDECVHNECRDGKCVEVNGAGESDQCIIDWDCEEH